MSKSLLVKPNYIRIYGHRGARGEIAENSIEGFKHTFALGIKAVEFDVVISKDKINGFYQVLNIETNKEGFVHSSFVQLDKMLPKNEDGIFTPVGKTSSTKPIIKIHNNTSLTLTLKLNDDLYTFSPQERKTLTLTSGSYTYRASAPGVLPDYGTENMQSNYEYEWSFYVSTSRN